jgi:hypothetical protein
VSGWARLVVIALCAYAPACSSAGDSRGPGNVLDDVPERHLRAVFRLGGLDAPEEQVFQSEPSLTVDRKDRLYVLHRDLGLIAVFDDGGGFVRWIRGGRGDGPGEFTTAMWLGLAGDTLWVRNLTPPRISMFLADGSQVGTDLVQVTTDYRTTMGIQGISGYLQGDHAWLVPDGFVMHEEGTAPRAAFVVGDRAMEARNPLFDWRADRGRLAGTSFDPIPEPPFYDVAPDGSRILLAEWSADTPGQLRLRSFAPDGAEAWRSSLPVPPQVVAPAVLDSLVEVGRARVGEVRERVIAAGIPPEHAPAVPTADEVRAEAYLPEFRPPIRGVRSGLDGTIWLQRPESASLEAWVVLDDRGTPLFRVRLPAGTHLREGSRGSIWATATGDLDVPYVIRFDIE